MTTKIKTSLVNILNIFGLNEVKIYKYWLKTMQRRDDKIEFRN